jgi:hypothetical protein
MVSTKFINHETELLYSVKWIVTWQSFKSAVYPLQRMGLMICCGMAVKRTGMLGVSVRKMKAPTMKIETVIKEDRWGTCFVY